MEDEKFALLRSHYLFSGAEPQVVERLARHGLKIKKKKGESLFQKGDPGDALYGIFEGKVAIATRISSGKEIFLNILEPGDFFGEIAFLDGLPRTAGATAFEDCTLLKVDRRDLLPILEQEPRLLQRFVELLCERIRWTSDLIEEAAFMHLRARLAKRFVSFAIGYGHDEERGIRIDLKLSQARIGQMMGVSREAVNKELREWEESGWILRDGEYYIVTDLEALKAEVAKSLEF